MYITNKYRVSYSLTEIKNPFNTGVTTSTIDANNEKDAVQNIKDHLDKYWKDYSYEIISVELVKENAIVLTYEDLEEMQ